MCMLEFVWGLLVFYIFIIYFIGIIKRLLDVFKVEIILEDILFYFMVLFESLVKCNFNVEVYCFFVFFIIYVFYIFVGFLFCIFKFIFRVGMFFLSNLRRLVLVEMGMFFLNGFLRLFIKK